MRCNRLCSGWKLYSPSPPHILPLILFIHVHSAMPIFASSLLLVFTPSRTFYLITEFLFILELFYFFTVGIDWYFTNVSYYRLWCLSLAEVEPLRSFFPPLPRHLEPPHWNSCSSYSRATKHCSCSTSSLPALMRWRPGPSWRGPRRLRRQAGSIPTSRRASSWPRWEACKYDNEILSNN